LAARNNRSVEGYIRGLHDSGAAVGSRNGHLSIRLCRYACRLMDFIVVLDNHFFVLGFSGMGPL
jgi:hypothetical protein